MKRLVSFTMLLLYLVNHINAQNVSTENLGKPFPTIKILSWNIYMLPPLIKFTDKKERAKYIGHLLKNSDYDVLVLQETFHPAARRIIIDSLKAAFPYIVEPPTTNKITLKTSSGITILCKHKMRLLGTITYNDKEGFDNKMARKGATMVEIEQDGFKYQLVGTHLNAGGPGYVRIAQIQQMQTALIAKFANPETLLFIAGDFNIDRYAEPEDYTKTMEILGLTTSHYSIDPNNLSLSATFEGIPLTYPGERIDFIFVKNNTAYSAMFHETPKISLNGWQNNHTELSDHNPVSCTFFWKSPY
ncbi:MAG: endonuclease/exonuclease/phosphatase family protein [Chitinophagales bacterium]|nr:endonuclease/exonuclease/phosphatase family protein [Chitinophagales bacterium]